MEQSFYLRGETHTVTAEGVHQWIRTPAGDGKSVNSRFQTAVQAALADARMAGITQPIVVGAIPFDTENESALYVPKSYKISKGTCEYSGPKDQPLAVKGTQLVPGHDEFTAIVSEAVREIRDEKLQKVVLARLNVVETQEPLDSGQILARLIEQNPEGFNFRTPLPDDSSYLIGSSPELLVAKRGPRFHSRPLAGSAARDPARDPAREKEIATGLLASEKDRYEHNVVVESMRSTLTPRSKLLDVPSAPQCICTPKLWHLATPISGTVADEEESVLSLACLLHPTPALSGYPHRDAHKLLTRLEPFDRKYFGGIVGYCDSNGNGEWFIVIRSGELQGRTLTLFGGAGIVGDSDPESEWLETRTKISTMLHAIGLA